MEEMLRQEQEEEKTDRLYIAGKNEEIERAEEEEAFILNLVLLNLASLFNTDLLCI